MLVVVTSVSLLVQIYSQGYMEGDTGYSRYYACMSLFTAAMLGLVMMDSILMVYVFWELVGLCSYLLIGFWFQKKSAGDAAKKAFLDDAPRRLGFLLGILLIWTQDRHLQHPAHPGRWRRAARIADTRDHAVRARALRRRRRQVGAVPAARLAARRDGGPDAGLRADPRRDDGRRRRLPRRAHVPRLRGVRRGAEDRRLRSAASPRSSPRRSASSSPTSSACWRTRRSASSAT